MIANCRVVLTRKKLKARQYLPDQSVIIRDSDSTENDPSFFDQAVELLLLIYRDHNTFIETEIANCTEE